MGGVRVREAQNQPPDRRCQDQYEQRLPEAFDPMAGQVHPVGRRLIPRRLIRDLGDEVAGGRRRVGQVGGLQLLGPGQGLDVPDLPARIVRRGHPATDPDLAEHQADPQQLGHLA